VPTLDTLKATSESLHSIAELIAIALVPYLAAMGWAQQYATRIWSRPIGKTLDNDAVAEAKKPFWRNPMYIQDGLAPAVLIAILLTFVVTFLAVYDRMAHAAAAIAVLLAFPNIGVSRFIILRIPRIRRLNPRATSTLYRVALVVGAAACSIVIAIAFGHFVGYVDTVAPYAIAAQIVLLVGLSILWSFTLTGLRALDEREPDAWVEVLMTNGHVMPERLRYVRTTKKEYRFIDDKGWEHAIPIGQVQRIRRVEPPADGAAP
jgi:hypothetical protein